MVYKGFQVQVCNYVMNAHLARRAMADDAARMSQPAAKRSKMTQYKSMYNTLPDKKDHSIMRGELVWTQLGDGNNPILGVSQQPIVRSVVNGATYRQAPGVKFEDTIRVLGVSRKTVIMDENDNPVYVLAGLHTMYNTGEDTIRPTEAVEWYLVSDTHRNQINDGVTLLNKNRLSLGLRPMRLTCDMDVICDNVPGFKEAMQQYTKHIFGIDEDAAKQMRLDMLKLMSPVMHAIAEPIVEAYENHVGILTMGSAARKRAEVIMWTPFIVIKLDPPVKSTLTSTTGLPPPPPPPPPANKDFDLDLVDPSKNASDRSNDTDVEVFLKPKLTPVPKTRIEYSITLKLMSALKKANVNKHTKWPVNINRFFKTNRAVQYPLGGKYTTDSNPRFTVPMKDTEIELYTKTLRTVLDTYTNAQIELDKLKSMIVPCETIIMRYKDVLSEYTPSDQDYNDILLCILILGHAYVTGCITFEKDPNTRLRQEIVGIIEFAVSNYKP